ncbi:MAG: hypothetical protein U0169_20255 [Polyangiaceae bacterium]
MAFLGVLVVATGAPACASAPDGEGLGAKTEGRDGGTTAAKTATGDSSPGTTDARVDAGAASSASSVDAGSATTVSACDAGADGGPSLVAPASPFPDPPRCANRPVMIGGRVVADDPRGNWCEYGACGQSGKATCRTVDTKTAKRTVKSCTGEDRCVTCTYQKVECGTTPACQSHDACYDERLQKNEYDSQDLFWAFRAYCDLPIASGYPAEEWSAWMQGQPGPSGYVSWLPYSELLGCTEAAGGCP